MKIKESHLKQGMVHQKKKQGMGILSPDTSVRHSNYFIVIIVIFKKEGEKVEGNFLI
jgi:hypothetical protein